MVSVTGKGSFVAESGGQHDARKTELLQKARPILAELKSLGATETELLQLWRGDEKHA